MDADVVVLYGKSRFDWFGLATSAVGDLDQDGFADFIVGAIAEDPDSLYNAGCAYLYSGKEFAGN